MRYLVLLLALFAGPALAQKANLWIDTDGGTCTRQGTPATYSSASSCSSMDAAINACTAGDMIRMKAGTYGAQSINRTKTTPGCTVIAETTATIGGLKTHGAWYEIQNIVGTGWDIDNTTGGPGTNNITCRGCSFSGNSGVWWVANGYSNISWIGGAFTNFDTTDRSQGFAIWSGEVEGGSTEATGLMVDGITFDDIQNTGGPGNHFEVIRIDGIVDGLTIRNSTFTNNGASSGVFLLSSFRGVKPINITWENNFIEQASGSSVVVNMNYQEQGSCENWTFRYNTFPPSAAPVNSPANVTGGSCNNTFTNVVWTGNLLPRGSCLGNTYNYNLGYGSSGSACSGTGNSVSSEAAVNFDTDGFHVLTGSSAIDAGGTGGNCIATDHDGNTRPRGSACDAGAHEFGAPGRSTDLDLALWMIAQGA